MSEFYLVFHSHIPVVFEQLLIRDMSASELEAATGLDNSSLQKTLKRLAVRGYVQRYKSGKQMKWRLAYKGLRVAVPLISAYRVMEGAL